MYSKKILDWRALVRGLKAIKFHPRISQGLLVSSLVSTVVSCNHSVSSSGLAQGSLQEEDRQSPTLMELTF